MKLSLLYRKTRPSAQAPGTIVFSDDRPDVKSQIRVIDYGKDSFGDQEIKEVSELGDIQSNSGVTWIKCTAIKDHDTLVQLGKRFKIHSLVLEDISNSNQRPKFEELGESIFVVARNISSARKTSLKAHQVSLIFGDGYLLSFQEDDSPVFDGVIERIRMAKGRIRKMKSDYLAYAILDALTEKYYKVFEVLGDEIEEMEDEVIQDPAPDTLQNLHAMKNKLLYMRKSTWPFREIAGSLSRSESSLIDEKTEPFFRDLQDCLVQLNDMNDSLRDLNSGLYDMYLSSVSFKMNEVMKVLTIIATIFIPLTFIAGIYGMNFEYIPELGYRYSYFILWGVMALLFSGMIYFFKRKNWL